MVVAPTLMGEVELKPFVEDAPISSFDGDRIRIHTEETLKCRIGDLIKSDMGDAAVIISIVHNDKSFLECRPVCKGRYRYKKLTEFHTFARAFIEN